MDRRHFVAGAIAAPVFMSGVAPAQTPPAVPIGDMHFHSFFGESKYHSRPLAPMMAAGRATLVAWSLSADALWFDGRTYKQRVDPTPAEAMGWFLRELDRIKAHVAEQKLKIVRTPADVDRAVAGEPHIVLAVEGANFIQGSAANVAIAYELGVRHMQLVHFTRNPLGDFQTEPPTHNALTGLGREVVQECNRLGILIDLAHSATATVQGVLGATRAPVVWSHSSVTTGPPAPQTAQVWQRRQLSLELAKAIAEKGGVVGLWAFKPDVGATPASYGERMAELAGLIGEDHVAFGTDINGLGTNFLLSTYAELRKVVEHWQRQKVPEARVRKLAIGNYARALKAAMQARRV